MPSADRDEGADAHDGEWIAIPLVVGAGHDGYRVDRFIHARITRLSRTRIRAIIERGQVRDGRGPIVRPAHRVRAGQVVTVMRPAPPEPEVVLDYAVRHQDPDLLVIDKPAGLPVHPSARYHRHTLTAVMRTRLGVGHGWEMAHRLDRETSGVMVFGRRGGSGSVLKRSFQHREVHKEYLALVHGRLEGSCTVEIPLGPAQGSEIRVKMGPRSPLQGGLPASTEVEALAHGDFRDGPITLVRARPRTGRQHQIRVHLAELGHGIVGDKLYGIEESWFLDVVEHGRPLSELGETLGLWRHALHAARLELPHPRDGQCMSFFAPWPEDLAAILPLPPGVGP
ncbi:RluA family pseudouridine synthase [Paraliomyxa miuraensis]|uniref:RluA family pseudouridine synthase n=1 Tax=Paraliomyxa miuraensis TaxID=376150 RepID=UPI0022568448|nr:RluA family pseudouridine synthase [Paraliomyxa miuraensis]MCX4242828.1 RluA family pseudouridine synthase [Paraliomyxa miuraensis]